MGKYFDGARKFEARRQEEETAVSVPHHSRRHSRNSSPMHATRKKTAGPAVLWPEPPLKTCAFRTSERTLTLWRCDPCQVVAVTPDTIRQPPMGWVKTTEQ